MITILSETAAVIFMKLSDGFQQKYYAAAAVIFYAVSFVFLTLSLKQLPAGIANAVWAGASTWLVAIIYTINCSWINWIKMQNLSKMIV